jgi:hypothetical protein
MVDPLLHMDLCKCQLYLHSVSKYQTFSNRPWSLRLLFNSKWSMDWNSCALALMGNKYFPLSAVAYGLLTTGRSDTQLNQTKKLLSLQDTHKSMRKSIISMIWWRKSPPSYLFIIKYVLLHNLYSSLAESID